MSRRCIRPWLLAQVDQMRSDREAVQLQLWMERHAPDPRFCPVSYRAVHHEQEIGE